LRTPNKKAVSTLSLIILMLCSAVFGALISYLLVMSTYYNMPENTTLLLVTNVNFSVYDATYFNVTILNPSNSISEAGITAIRLTVEEGNKTYEITDLEIDGEPVSFPYEIGRGTEQTFKCKRNWSEFAGELVRIEPVTTTFTASIRSYLYKVPTVKLIVVPSFDPYESVEYFMLTVENPQESEINLTVSDIMLFGMSISENLTSDGAKVELPQTLPRNKSITFQCNYNWEGLRKQNVTLTVKTSEGYESVYTTDELPGAVLYIDEIRFDYTDPTYFNLTVSSSEYSTATAIISGINLTLRDRTPFAINETRSHVPFKTLLPVFRSIRPNNSTTFECFWNWTQYRNETFTANVYTEQGFTVLPPTKPPKTPLSTVWNISDVKFDLDDTEHFLVNVTNMRCSLHEINVTKIEFNQDPTVMNSSVIDIDDQATFSCKYNWTGFVGENATITVHITYNENESSILYNLTLPYFKIRGVPFSNFSLGNSYVNITIYTSEFSTINATITQIFIETEGGTRPIDGTITNPKISPDGYELAKGTEITIVCPWDWNPYLGENVTVIVQTADGFQASKTVQVEQSLP